MLYFNFEDILFLDKCFDTLAENLKEYGRILIPDEEESFKDLFKHLFLGLKGGLSPNLYLNSLPPGSGKTTAIISFLKVWKSYNFIPSGGILIFLRTKEEIKDFEKGIGLEPRDFACLTSDDKINEFGGGPEVRDTVPVLITTQQMITSRTKDRSFRAASDFHYRGKPRALRIWDESFVLAEPIAISLYDLKALPAKLRYGFPKAVEAFQLLEDGFKNGEPGALLKVPNSLADDLAKIEGAANYGTVDLSKNERNTVQSLRLAAGRQLKIVSVRIPR